MKAIKPRGKSKKTNGRFGRVKFGSKESSDNAGPDLSQLRKPIDISVSSLLQVTRLLETGSNEVKTILAYECDVVYECRVCRSLFRSLANFISHKRVYCREKFNVTLYRKNRNDHIIPDETFMTDAEEPDDSKSKEDDDNIRILRSQVPHKSAKKDLTSVVDMLQNKQSEETSENLLVSTFGICEPSSEVRRVTRQTNLQTERNEAQQQLLLEAINTSKSAVYQTVVGPKLTTVHTADLMKAQIMELQNMVSRNTAVINPVGPSSEANQPEKHDNPVQICGTDDEEGTNADALCTRDLVCSVCNAKFATRKTLTYHMKSLHVSYRTCYPCPCCSSTFANTWSVYRHLYKVHRKSNEQVRKLRTQIQEKAFRKESTGAEDIEKENSLNKASSSPEQQTSNDTQEWMEHFELDLELQRCGGCGRRFDRKAALISHSQICVKRIAACNEAATLNKARRLAKTPSPNNAIEEPKNVSNSVVAEMNGAKKQSSETNHSQKIEGSLHIRATASGEITPAPTLATETSIRVESVSRISDADWEMIGSNSSKSPKYSKDYQSSIPNTVTEIGETQPPNEDLPTPTKVPDSPEIIYTSIDKARAVSISFGSKKRKVTVVNDSKVLSNGTDQAASSLENSPIKEQEPVEPTPDHNTIMENRIAMIANLRKLQCLPCRRKFTSMTNLRRHMAIHIGWNRYRCKLCDFKCFVKCDCVAHCNKMHDAKNNRAVIADMVMQIPPDQSTLAHDILMDISSSYETNSEPELIDVTTSSPTLLESNEDTSKSLDCPLDKSDDETDRTEPEKDPPPTEEPHANRSESTNEEELRKTKSRLDNDPDLRKMVMEVIFGTVSMDAAQAIADTHLRDSSPGADTRKDSEYSPVKLNETQKSAQNNENSMRGCADASNLEDTRPQRPTRNRVKPINQDYIYDLTELIRKESTIHREKVIGGQKTSKKKQCSQHQATDPESDGNVKTKSSLELENLLTVRKLPAIAPSKKGESNDFASKFCLKQAELKLTSLSIISPTNNVRSTKISVSNQK